MTIKHYRDYFIQELTPLYVVGEAESFFYLILEAKHQLKRVDIALQPDLAFSETELESWSSILEQLKKENTLLFASKVFFFNLIWFDVLGRIISESL